MKTPLDATDSLRILDTKTSLYPGRSSLLRT
jgi:hypothetical protein